MMKEMKEMIPRILVWCVIIPLIAGSIVGAIIPFSFIINNLLYFVIWCFGMLTLYVVVYKIMVLKHFPVKKR